MMSDMPMNRENPSMRMTDILQAPLRSTFPAVRWLSLAIGGACCVAAVASGVFVGAPHGWLIAVMLYCFGVGYLWAFGLSAMLLLSIDARQLRLPQIQRVVIGSIAGYGVITVLLPVFAMGVWGEHAVLAGLLAALAAAAALAFVLLPRYLAMLFCFLPALNGVLRHQLGFPGITDPRFLLWGGIALLLLVLLDVGCWRHLLRAQATPTLGFSGAMVMQFRRNGGRGNWNVMTGVLGSAGWGSTAPHNSSEQLRQRPNWMQPRANLRGVGPASLRRTFQVAFGGLYLPQSFVGHLRQMAPVLLPLILYVPFLVMLKAEDAHDHTWRHALTAIGVGIIGWVGLFGGMLLVFATVFAVRRRWRKSSAELALLRLLPGLGDIDMVRRELVYAAIGKPLLALGLLLVLVLSAGLMTMHLGAIELLFVALAQLTCAAVIVAFVLATLGGNDLSAWASTLVLVVTFVLVVASTFMPLAMVGKFHWQPGALVLIAFAASWAALMTVLLWTGRRGWRGMQQRPHPFLAN